MKAVIGVKMPPKVALPGIKKNIVFCVGMINSSLFMFFVPGYLGWRKNETSVANAECSGK